MAFNIIWSFESHVFLKYNSSEPFPTIKFLVKFVFKNYRVIIADPDCNPFQDISFERMWLEFLPLIHRCEQLMMMFSFMKCAKCCLGMSTRTFAFMQKKSKPIYIVFKFIFLIPHHMKRNLHRLDQGTNARKVNCGHVYSAYILKSVLSSRNL